MSALSSPSAQILHPLTGPASSSLRHVCFVRLYSNDQPRAVSYFLEPRIVLTRADRRAALVVSCFRREKARPEAE
jgi:hypothetical protein